jgi:ankyrin repeat protein
MLIKERHNIDKLSRMWPNEAAEQAVLIWSTKFQSDVPWDEIKNNIATGGVTGFGWGYTLLHAFATRGEESAIKMLLHNGADINSTAKSTGYTPLHLAVMNQNSRVVALLLENGAVALYPDASGMTAWGLSVSGGDLESVKALRTNLNIDVTAPACEGQIGTKPLMLAAVNGREEIVEFLINEGAENEGIDSDGNTALILASAHKRLVQTVEVMLKMGANVNASNNRGITA